MIHPASSAAFAHALAVASARADAEGAALREEIRLGVNDALLRLVDDLDREIHWRRDEAGFLRREGARAEAAKLEGEAAAFEAVCVRLWGTIYPDWSGRRPGSETPVASDDRIRPAIGGVRV